MRAGGAHLAICGGHHYQAQCRTNDGNNAALLVTVGPMSAALITKTAEREIEIEIYK